jgi:hypothetical protein
VGVTPWLAAMEEHREACGGTDGADQTMRLVWIGRNFTDLDAFAPYLPKTNTCVYLTRLAKRSRSVSFRSQTDDPTQQIPDATPKSVRSPQDNIRIEKPLPWMPALVGIASLFLTQISYRYINGDASDKNLNRSSQWRYFWAKALPVLCSFTSIAISALAARWASRSSLFSSCPCFSRSSSNGAAAPRPLQVSFSQHQASSPLAKGYAFSVKLERPDMVTLIKEALADAKAVPRSSSFTNGLFVCVCGPQSLVRTQSFHQCKIVTSCTGAVVYRRRAQLQGPGSPCHHRPARRTARMVAVTRVWTRQLQRATAVGAGQSRSCRRCYQPDVRVVYIHPSRRFGMRCLLLSIV